jgi:MarR-like DNA-binding transcriptional regulator SgrR of sgrS sRNA
MSFPLNRRTLLAGGAALASATLARPHFARAQGGGGNRSTLRFIPSTPLPSLDPIVATSYVIRNHGYLIYDTLFATDANFQIKPQMVSEWQTAPDGLKWTFHLRDGLAFHDGQPVRAQDCIASIQRWSKRDAFGQTFANFVERLHRGRCPHLQHQPEEALPAAAGRARQALLQRALHHAGAGGADRCVQADLGRHRLRPLAVREGASGCRARTPSTPATPPTSRARRRPPGPPAARSPRSTASSGWR